MQRTLPLLSLLVVMVLALIPQTVVGQDFVTTAMSGLPTQTMRVEYSSPSKLRKLSNYQALRGKFLGPRLQQLESTLEQIGVREDDIDELMIGWKPGDKEMDLYGFASGNFDKAQVASRAAAQNLTPTPISGQQAYCLSAGVAGTCVVILENSLGAFGPLSSLTSLLEAHDGQSPSLSSDSRFTSLLGDVIGQRRQSGQFPLLSRGERPSRHLLYFPVLSCFAHTCSVRGVMANMYIHSHNASRNASAPMTPTPTSRTSRDVGHPSRRDRAALFSVVVNLCVVCAFAACISSNSAFVYAEFCPVGYSKYIEVPNFSECDHVALPLCELIPFRRHEWLWTNTILSVFANLFKEDKAIGWSSWSVG